MARPREVSNFQVLLLLCYCHQGGCPTVGISAVSADRVKSIDHATLDEDLGSPRKGDASEEDTHGRNDRGHGQNTECEARGFRQCIGELQEQENLDDKTRQGRIQAAVIDVNRAVTRGNDNSLEHDQGLLLLVSRSTTCKLGQPTQAAAAGQCLTSHSPWPTGEAVESTATAIWQPRPAKAASSKRTLGHLFEKASVDSLVARPSLSS